MIRKILCAQCGALKPMHPEDIAMGWQRRRLTMKVRKPDEHFIKINEKRYNLGSLRCDNCGSDIANGTEAVAETMWRNEREAEPGQWENDYLAI